MQARRMLSLSAVFLATACSVSMLGACGDDDQTIIYVYLEAGAQDSGKKDGSATPISDDDDAGDPGPTTCDPQQVPAFSFKYPGKYLGKCSDEVLGEFYDKCMSSTNKIADCDAAKLQYADCATCAFGTVDSADGAHPWLIFDEGVTAFPNFGLCMATVKNETASTECGVAYHEFFDCLNEACVTPCAPTQNPDAFDLCLQAANEAKLCPKGGTTALSAKCRAAYAETNPTYGFCTSQKDEQGKDMDERTYMVAIARLTCGFDPAAGDGGIKDGGSDADASDAGDAGDADADAP